MNAAFAVTGREGYASGACLVTGIFLATLAEAIAGTIFSLGRSGVIGDTHATPDEVAWLDIGYITLKLIGFVTAPTLMSSVNRLNLIIASSLVIGTTCAIATVTARLDLLVVLRVVQGYAGGILLVAAQTTLFLAFARRSQPLVQALFAIGAVVAPTTVVPALQGWLLDDWSWTWIFFSAVSPALFATGLLLLTDSAMPPPISSDPPDWIGLSLLSATLFCLTYILIQGSRWNWLEEPRVLWLTVTVGAALLIFSGQQILAGHRRLLDYTAFRSSDFSFAFAASFVAGAALLGSAFLIPSFAVSVLALTPSDAGLLLLPSGALFVAALLLTTFLVQVRKAPPIATVPLGILMIMGAMWILSGSSSESGADDMANPVLLRGLGLGFLFLSITLIAFSNLDSQNLATGIGLFNVGRQLGGLAGVAGLQTLIDRSLAHTNAVLGANISAGVSNVGDRLTASASLLAERGLDTQASTRGAITLLSRAVTEQSMVIAFDAAFAAVAFMFLFAAPVLLGLKFALSRYGTGAALRP